MLRLWWFLPVLLLFHVAYCNLPSANFVAVDFGTTQTRVTVATRVDDSDNIEELSFNGEPYFTTCVIRNPQGYSVCQGEELLSPMRIMYFKKFMGESCVPSTYNATYLSSIGKHVDCSFDGELHIRHINSDARANMTYSKLFWEFLDSLVHESQGVRPSDLAEAVLRYVKTELEKKYDISSATFVFTYPAVFHENQVAALKKSVRRAGFPGKHFLIPEPVAAAYAYLTRSDLPRNDATETLAFVFDFGGGTLDMALMRIYGRKSNMQATNQWEIDPSKHVFGRVVFDSPPTDNTIGGVEISSQIMQFMLDDANMDAVVPGFSDCMSVQCLRNKSCSDEDMRTSWQEFWTAVNARKEFCSSPTEYRDREPVYDLLTGCKITSEQIPCDAFDVAAQEPMRRVKALVDEFLDSVGVKNQEVGHVLLSGGQTRSKFVRDSLIDIFTATPIKTIPAPWRSDQIVVSGALMYGLCKSRVALGANGDICNIAPHITLSHSLTFGAWPMFQPKVIAVNRQLNDEFTIEFTATNTETELCSGSPVPHVPRDLFFCEDTPVCSKAQAFSAVNMDQLAHVSGPIQLTVRQLAHGLQVLFKTQELEVQNFPPQKAFSASDVPAVIAGRKVLRDALSKMCKTCSIESVAADGTSELSAAHLNRVQSATYECVVVDTSTRSMSDTEREAHLIKQAAALLNDDQTTVIEPKNNRGWFWRFLAWLRSFF